MRRFVGLISAGLLVFTVACGQTDAGITTNVKTKLAADDMVKAYEVDVTTQNRVVTLTGEVETSAARDQAMRIARETDGVRDVIDQLRVEDTAATTGSDDPNAIERGIDELKEGAREIGEGARDAVTDDDRDTDRDGR